MGNPWLDCKRLPPGAAAALAALHFADPRPEALGRLGEKDRRDALDFVTRSQLALFTPRDLAPQRFDENAAKNRERLSILHQTYRQVAKTLDGVDFVALKGITQCALFGIDPERRAQYDIDLYCPGETVEQARDAFLAVGYELILGMEGFPTDHLPALIRRTGWEWREDYFDPGIPLSIELHFRFWNPDLERLPAPGVDQFWNRRIKQAFGGVELNVLCPADALAYAALHLLRHLLRGSVRPFHVYEIASFLRLHAHGQQADSFWAAWRGLHGPELRRLQAVSFRLAESWFGCALAPAAREEIERLPAPVLAWFDEFAQSPATQRFHPNKDELWLHLALLDSRMDALSVARRRLFPANLPPPVKATYLPESALTLRRRVRLYLDYATYFKERVRHHVVSLGTTLTSGARWWWRTNGLGWGLFTLGKDFWRFLTASVVFTFALGIFFLLYNLYLLDLGYHEQVVGRVNSAARAGSLIGTLPAALLAARLGLKRTLIATIGATAAVTLVRAFVATQFPLTALSFIEGAIFAVWAVLMAPCIAGVVQERRRATAFSLFFATMFATGIVSNWIGGRLPVLLHGKQNTLIFSALLVAVAILPALRMRSGAPPAVSRAHIYPRGRFLPRFLVPYAVWHLATGAFNPFNNVYFSRLKFTVREIGDVFSASQMVQVVAVLFAPLMIRRLGLVNGIVWMMMATAAGLGMLASQPPGFTVVLAYAAYMAFQWMSEPGLMTLVMNHVREEERPGASSITNGVAFGSQALAAFGAGLLIERVGYPPVLFGAALLALLASVLFRGVVKSSQA